MSLWTFLFGESNHSSSHFSNTTNTTTINPASGLPMVHGIGSVDVAGNVFGSNSSHHWAGTDSMASLNSHASVDSHRWDSGTSFSSGSSFGGGSSFGSGSGWD